jgi:hypothetical protein
MREETHMKRFLMLMAFTFAAAGVRAETPTVTGTWNMGLQGDHVVPIALVLKQDGTKLTGTLAMPTQHVGQRVDVEMTGEIADGAFTISGEVPGAAEPTTISVAAALKDDGSLEGTVAMRDHKMPFTAERLKERK